MTQSIAVDRPSSRTHMLGNADLRRYNLSATLQAVNESDGRTRAELAEATGLTKTAIGVLVKELIDRGIVVETAPISRVGRPSPPLRIARERFTAVIVDVGATYVTATVCDLAGCVLRQTTTLSKRALASDATEPFLAQAIEAMDEAQMDGRRLAGVVIAIHGLVAGSRKPDGPHVRAHTLAREVAHVLGSRSSLLIIENDAHLGALAEWARRRGSNLSSLVYLSGELSLGAAIVLDGRLHRGARGLAARFSHITLDPAGPECECGRRGCWHMLVGLQYVLRAALPDAADDLETVPGYAHIAVDALVDAARRGDQQTITALAEAGRWLGEGAANVANTIDPQVIVIGSYFDAVAEWIMPAAATAFDRDSYRACSASDVLAISDLAAATYHTGAVSLERSRVVGGGVCAVTDRLLDDPLRWTPIDS